MRSDDQAAIPLLLKSLDSLKEALNSAKGEGVEQDGLRLIEEAIESTQKAYNKLTADLGNAATVLKDDLSVSHSIKFSSP